MLFAGACLAWKKKKQASRSKGRFDTRRLGKSRACKASDSGAIFWASRLEVPRGNYYSTLCKPYRTKKHSQEYTDYPVLPISTLHISAIPALWSLDCDVTALDCTDCFTDSSIVSLQPHLHPLAARVPLPTLLRAWTRTNLGFLLASMPGLCCPLQATRLTAPTHNCHTLQARALTTRQPAFGGRPATAVRAVLPQPRIRTWGMLSHKTANNRRLPQPLPPSLTCQQS
jgi:hypothetical protein